MCIILYLSKALAKIQFMKTFRIRVAILWSILLFFAVALISMFFHLQVVNKETILESARSLKTRVRLYPPERGNIYTRNGKLIATNTNSIDIVTFPLELRGQIPEELEQFFGKEAIDEIRKLKSYYPYIIKADISYEEAAQFLPIMINAPYFHIAVVKKRFYPFAEIYAHVVGHIKAEKNYKFKGMYGIERIYDEILEGEPSRAIIEVNAYGKELRVIDEIKGKKGEDIFLTIHSELQEHAYKLMVGKEGAIVAMNPKNGEILAFVSTPSFDPNTFSRRPDLERWKEYVSDENKPLLNRAVFGGFHPGSVFKIIVAIAALEEKAISPDYKISCKGKFQFGKRTFRCWKKEGHGAVDLIDAIAKSCDVYFYNLGLKLGVDKISKYAFKLGLGMKTGIDFSVESQGIIPTREWKRKVLKDKWYDGENISLAIGQGYTTTTPLQIARATAAIVNGGYLVKPHLVKRIGDRELEYKPEKIDLNESTLKIVKEGMINTVEYGTAYGSRIPGLKYGGKTGTSQVISFEGLEKILGKPAEKISFDEIPKRFRDHAWFTAFAPAEDPEIVVTVLVEHCGGGAKCAAPIAKEIILKYIEIKNKELKVAGTNPKMQR